MSTPSIPGPGIQHTRDGWGVQNGAHTAHTARTALTALTAHTGATAAEPTLLVAEQRRREEPSLASLSSQAFPNGAVISAACVHESLAILEACVIDIVIVDLHLPDGSGMEVLEECTRSSQSTLCVVTTAHHEGDDLLQALAAGASGCLLKDQSETVLIQQLRLIAGGVLPLALPIAQRLVECFTEQSKTAAASQAANDSAALDDLAPLSRRETQVLCLIAKGLQISEASQLLEISANTACSHVKNIYRKRHISSRAEAALEAQRLGLV